MVSKKILQFILCLVLVAGITFGQRKVMNEDNGIYEIPKTTVVPVIDGMQDPVWQNVDWNYQTSYGNNAVAGEPQDWTDLFGAHKLMYDDDNLYMIFYTQDDDPVGNDAAVVNWQRNAIEVYLDGDNSKLHSVVAPDHHLTFRHEHIDDEANSDWDVETGLDTSGIQWKIMDDANMIGYWVELKVPLSAIDFVPIAGTEIGLEFQQDDNDANGRDAVSKWFLQVGDSSWQYASCWGTGVLSGRIVGSDVEIKKLPAGASITVDGEWDGAYSAALPITTNSFGNNGTYPDNFADNFVTTYLLYDDDNLYGFFEVLDDDPVGNDAAVVNWQRNAVELYLDGDNSKLHSVVLPDHHLTFRHEHIDDEANSDWDVETGLDSSNLVWKIKDVMEPLMGYTVEFKIPLAAVDMVPTEGQNIGLEIQTDDNDGSGRDVVTKWFMMAGDSSWQYATTWGTAWLGGPGVVDAVIDQSQLATSYSLLQNYPNPFNPTTNIVYSIPQASNVKLTVYNLLGSQVTTLVNEAKNAGTYTVSFNASNLSSGVYFYKLETGNKVMVNKMLLLK